MSWFWIALVALVAVAFLRLRARMRPQRPGAGVDDDAIRRIIDEGSYAVEEDDDASLDLDEIARAEDAFWEESWDEPEEYGG